jgi:cell fate (sporulation/competence/biofilm development) regulator YlbF (YheA/YmcA/DUF963 family)
MNLKTKAVELAEAIKDSEEYKDLRSAEAQMQLDPNAMDLLEEFQTSQQQLMMAQQTGQQVDQDTIQKMQSLEQQMQLNQSIKKVMEKRQAFEEVMQGVNETISETLSS